VPGWRVSKCRSHRAQSTGGCSATARAAADGAAVNCKINVKATNSGTRTVAISRDSQVRSCIWGCGGFGPWKQLDQSIWIDPGQTRNWTYDLTFRCDVGRQYRFLVKQFDSQRKLLNQIWYYHPNYGVTTDYGVTTSKSLDLGNLSRLF